VGRAVACQYLRDAVGATGEVIGVEVSRAVAANAERRVARNAWANVRVVVAPAQTVQVTGTFDGLLTFAAPDVYGSAEAWDNLRPHLSSNARVVFFGAKTSARRGGRLLNGLLRRMMPRLSFASTPVPDAAPWRVLAPSLDSLQIEEYFFGWMFARY
jgi:hypothetical protein